uniref:Coiled-coil domain containing 142 n=1 Tax=Paramormyrops kingsleyae TaxID=1676925 RepID=A0A3B3RW36_9TELE|nr:coiled-coil domain-containing protein 142 isoform X1 [Paramormyrops kingsleyae]XP_023655730.1 coiled-coil domain-containing protein 142 isoform X1 [Paramormyrops kingsleyae]XP_023655731.1 coiled-coil domain-containing protein 142 isoform X1 [Paramormyrops kingsleyae]XP_023655732.1 coiled-coil domain-containing protein 142 isoform X1 [Paramormyrops kingsleyae]
MAQRKWSPSGVTPPDGPVTEQRGMPPACQAPPSADPVDGDIAAQVLKRCGGSWEAPCEERAECPWGRSAISRSLGKAESLLRNRLTPGLGGLLGYSANDGSGTTGDFEDDDTLAARQDLPTRSSRRLQRLEEGMLGLSQQYHVMREPGWGARACIRSCSSDGEFYRYPEAATVGQHYGQLRGLLEERAQLLFLHEHARRTAAAASFVEDLAHLLEQEWPPFGADAWGNGVGAACADLRVHVGHWEHLCAKARADPWLRRAPSRMEHAFDAARQTLSMLSVQAVALVERYIHKALCAVARADPTQVPVEVLEDLFIGAKAFNHILGEQRIQLQGAQRRSPLTPLSGVAAAGPQGGAIPMPFTVSRVLRVLSEHRGRVAAEEVHHWLASRSRLLAILSCPVPRSQTWDSHFSSLRSDLFPADKAGDTSQRSTKMENSCQELAGHPLADFVKQDAEFREKLLQSLLSSADLLGPRVPSRARPEQPSAESELENEGRQDGEGMDIRKWKCVQWQDMGKMDACVALLGQYEDMVWREFGATLLALLYQPGRDIQLGSLNHCKDWMVFLVVKELHASCRSDAIPVGYERAISDLCSQVVAKTAFMHWDEVMCASLGAGLKDRGVPVPGSTARTRTAELHLQLFPPLSAVLGTLTPPTSALHTDPRNLRLLRLGTLHRSVTTVHSATFWAVSKGYQFLSSWSINKFLLVTQGDLKALRAAVERLVQQVEELPAQPGGGALPADQQVVLLSQAAAALQGFSPLLLKMFSQACKQMSREIFEQSMPSVRHWRARYKTDLPASPSEYAASAARAVIGQVLEGTRPLPEGLGDPALAEATVAFMEAWMEHILRQKIRFSLQGALQLKQDFDLVRSLVRSEEYSLSEDTCQRLLSLRVFHQADSAIVCLLQQPVTKPYLPRRAWESFRLCCPNRSHPFDAAAGSLSSLESMDIQAARSQALTEALGSLVPHLPPTSPSQSYLAASQQEWLALRVSSAPHWRIPGLHCMRKAEQ